jgi:hypothetical protein
MAMKNELLDEIGDTIFTIAIAAAIGLAVANLAIQITARAVLDAANVGQENVSTTISEGIRHDISPVG